MAHSLTGSVNDVKLKNDVLFMGPGEGKRYGPFCERFGDPAAGGGSIPDWRPVDFRPGDLRLPPWVRYEIEFQPPCPLADSIFVLNYPRSAQVSLVKKEHF